MNLTIEIPEEVAAVLLARAQAQGLSPDRLASCVLQDSLGVATAFPEAPYETGYGSWAGFGVAPSAEEFEENRREMFRNFAQRT